MKKIFIILLTVVGITLSSCDYLNIDRYFGDELKLDSVFSNKRYTQAYLWDIATQFPDESNDAVRGGVTPGPLATDEAFTAFGEGNEYPGLRYVLGRYSAASPLPGDLWATMYRIIRRCNTLLARSSEASDMTPTERNVLNSYARFLRAYAYYRLAMDYGPVILLGDEVINNNESLEYYDRPRHTYDETVEYICSEFEESARYLPIEQTVMEQGRPTKGAAYGMIARLRLIHASPLYNGGESARFYFSRWTRKTDGVHYISQTYDERRWAVAAAAAKRVIDMNQYDLYTALPSTLLPPKPMPENITSDPDYYKPWSQGGAAGIDHFKSYSDVFTGEAVLQTNPEMVWGRNTGSLAENLRACFPRSNGGWNSMCLTQKVVDAFFMFDGRTINDSSTEYPYTETGSSEMPDNFSNYRLNADVYNMYINREMRFYASVGFSNRYWGLRSATSTVEHTILYNRSSPNGRIASATEYPPTGYVVTKYVHNDDAFQGDNNRRIPKIFGIIRYAEILLSYVEALNNLTTQYTIEVDGQEQTFQRDPEAMRLAFGKVRHRAGLPAPTQAELGNAVTMQLLIEKERMIELLFENRRYYDVRRWGKYEETEYETIMGMNAEGDGDNFYRRTMPATSYVKNRIVNRKLILVPIPLSEVRRLPSLDQNPGWEE